MAQGTIKRLVGLGFGLITPDDDGQDLAFHATAVVQGRFEHLHRGQRVEYDLGTDPRTPERPRAVNVRPIRD